MGSDEKTGESDSSVDLHIAVSVLFSFFFYCSSSLFSLLGTLMVRDGLLS